MMQQRMKNKFLLSAVLCLSIVSLISSDSYAWGGHRYHGGRWYDDGWFWAGAGVTALAVGEMVTSLPPGYTTVYYGGAPYYYCGGTYFVYSSRGYVAVPPPAGVMVAPSPVTYIQQAPMVPASPESVTQATTVSSPVSAPASDTFEVYVPNSDNTYTLVSLKKTDKGYVGPQGELYPEHPTIEKLKVLYGKTTAKA